MIQAEFENGIEDENNLQEIDFQNGAEPMKMMLSMLLLLSIEYYLLFYKIYFFLETIYKKETSH
jgi:hypothetical protein